jgi:hypothetical protein
LLFFWAASPFGASALRFGPIVWCLWSAGSTSPFLEVPKTTCLI